MEIKNPRYVIQDGHPMLELEIDDRPCTISWEVKPTVLRSGFVFLGGDFADRVPPVTVAGNELRGFTGDPTVFRLAIAFGLECYYGRFAPGPARQQPDPAEVAELGERLEPFAKPDAPKWEELTRF